MHSIISTMSIQEPKVTVAVTKSISFRYSAPKELMSLFDDFRSMCNEAIRMAVQGKPKNKFKLIELAYPRLKEWGLHTHYILSSIEVAFSVYKNKGRKSIPCVKKPFLKLDNQSYRLDHLLLRIPTTPRQFIFLTLQGSAYHLSFIDDSALKKGSVTIGPESVSLAFSKVVEQFKPVGCLGMDINEGNATVSSTDGLCRQFTELNEVVEIKERYREIRARIGRLTGNDRRTCKGLLAKYGQRERNRTELRVHRITCQIVRYAKENKLGIKMEKLTGIRRRYKSGNQQGSLFRGRMNAWVFGETQRQIDYKSRWNGVPSWYVNPRGTSRKCPDCGSRVVRMANRKLYCPRCDKEWDRDVLASRNIMACAVPQARPSRGSNEGERGDDGSDPPSRWGEGWTRLLRVGRFPRTFYLSLEATWVDGTFK